MAIAAYQSCKGKRREAYEFSCVLESIKVLLNAGADPLAKNRDGSNAISYAEAKNLEEIVALLKPYSAR